MGGGRGGRKRAKEGAVGGKPAERALEKVTDTSRRERAGCRVVAEQPGVFFEEPFVGERAQAEQPRWSGLNRKQTRRRIYRGDFRELGSRTISALGVSQI